MKYKDFCAKCFENTDPNEMLPNGTDPQEGLEILIEHFLGHLPIVDYTCRARQWNSEAIAEVLEKYPEGKLRRIPK